MKDTYRKPAAEPRGDTVSMTLAGQPGPEAGNAAQVFEGGARLSFGL